MKNFLKITCLVLLNFISTAVRGGVPLFFMLSGALFLSRAKLDTRRLLIRHALRMTGLFYLWSLFYALLRVLSGALAFGQDFLFAVVSGHYHMWFLPAMVMCYLFFPPVHAALHGQKLDGRYLLGLFFGLGLLMANLNLTPDPAPILFRFTQNFSLEGMVACVEKAAGEDAVGRAAGVSSGDADRRRMQPLVFRLQGRGGRVAVQLFLDPKLSAGKRRLLLFPGPAGS